MGWFKAALVILGSIIAFGTAAAEEGLAEKQRALIELIRQPDYSGSFGGVTDRYSSQVLALGAGARPLIPALCEAVKNSRSREAFETLDALGPMTYARLPEFLNAFAHLMKTSPGGKSGYNVGIYSCKLLREDLTPLQLVAFSEHSDEEVRWIVLETLLHRFEGKELPDEYVRVIGRRLEDDSPAVRDVAQRFLYGRPELGQALLPELAEAFRLARPEEQGAMQRFREDGSFRHVGRVTMSLAGAISRCEEGAIDEVFTFLDHPSEPHRVLAVAMLGTMATPDTTERVLARLDELAKDANRHVASRAIESLASLGGRSRTRLLIEILEQGPGDRTVAVRHLGRLRDSAAIEPLERTLAQTQDVPLRIAAAYALGAMGPMASETLPTVREAFESDDPELRFAAACAFRNLTDSTDEAIAMFETFVVQAKEGEKRSDGRMRFYAPHAESALGHLNGLATDERSRHEERLLEVLSNLDLAAKHYRLPQAVEAGLSRYGGERTLAKVRELLRGSSIADRARTDLGTVVAAIKERQRTETSQTASLEIAIP